jgi:hypothetical protein
VRPQALSPRFRLRSPNEIIRAISAFFVEAAPIASRWVREAKQRWMREEGRGKSDSLEGQPQSRSFGQWHARARPAQAQRSRPTTSQGARRAHRESAKEKEGRLVPTTRSTPGTFLSLRCGHFESLPEIPGSRNTARHGFLIIKKSRTQKSPQIRLPHDHGRSGLRWFAYQGSADQPHRSFLAEFIEDYWFCQGVHHADC